MCLVEKFFIFDLAVTAVVLGWLGAAGAFVTIITSALSIGNFDQYLANSSIFDGWDKGEAREMLETFQGTYIAFSVIHLLACILLVAGAVKRNRLLLIPWLIENGINLIFTAITIIFFTLILMSHTESVVSSVFIFLSGVLLLSLFIYCWTAVYSLYVYLREGEMVPLMPSNSPFSYTYVRIA